MTRLLLTLLLIPLHGQITVGLEGSATGNHLFPTYIDTVQVDLYVGKTYQYTEKFLLSLDNTIILSTPLRDNVYIVIRHRNHLDIVSGSAVRINKKTGEIYYNFMNGSAFNNSMAQKKIGNKWYMIAGDVDGNGYIQTLDKQLWRYETGMYGYLASDLNFDWYSQTTDKNEYILKNLGYGSQIETWLGE